MDVLIVSAFYKIESKRPFEEYLKRIGYFIHNTICKVIIFTSSDMLEILPRRENVEFHVLDKHDFYSNSFATNEEYKAITELYSSVVAEKPISVDLIKIYAEKHMFVNRAIDMYPGYSYYIWNDLGLVIGEDVIPYLYTYPSISKIRELNIGDKVCFGIRDIVSLKEYESGIPDKRIRLDCPVAGTIILGNKNAWRKFIVLYHKSLNYLKDKGKCWGNDEHVYFHMLCNNPNDVTGVITYGFKLPIRNIYQCNSWNMFCYMMSHIFTDPILKFKPIRPFNKVSNIKNAKWGNEYFYFDATNIFKNKQDTSSMYIDFKLFPYDPLPGKVKYLSIEYTDGSTDVIPEYKYLHINDV